MLEVCFDNKNNLINDNILECSSLLNEIYRFKETRDVLPMYELTEDTYIILSEFLNLNKNFEKYCYEDFIFINKDFLNKNTKRFLKNFETKTLLELLEVSIAYEIFILSETIAYILSKRKISFVFENDIYLKYSDKKIKISSSLALTIIKYLDKNDILNIDNNILKKFDYNPLFDSNYDYLFDVDIVYLDTLQNSNTNKIVLKYGRRKDYSNQVIKILNIVLTKEDIEHNFVFNCSEIKYIENNCFECSNIKSIDLSNLQDFSIETLNNISLRNCENLENIILPNCSSLQDYCFENCKKLQTIKIPITVKKIGKCCFKNCESIEFIAVPSEIEANCFENCCKLKTVRLTNNIKIIPENCFLNCVNLKTINLDNIKIFSQNCFKNCGFEKLAIVDVEMHESAFENCINLVNLEICQVILSENCFKNCINLRHIGMTAVKEIPTRCFENCVELRNLIVNTETTALKYAFLNCLKLENIKGKIKTTKNTFKGCKKL